MAIAADRSDQRPATIPQASYGPLAVLALASQILDGVDDRREAEEALNTVMAATRNLEVVTALGMPLLVHN